MTYPIVKTPETVDGLRVLRFRLQGHADNPMIDLRINDYPSGVAMRAAVLAWAAQYGGGAFV